MSCMFEWGPQYVVKRFTGFVSAEEFVASAQAVAADPRFDDLRLIVNDLSTIEGHAIDAHAYLMVAASRIGAMRTNPNYRVAFIAQVRHVFELEEIFRPGLQGLPFDPVVVENLEQAFEFMADAPDLDNPITRF